MLAVLVIENGKAELGHHDVAPTERVSGRRPQDALQSKARVFTLAKSKGKSCGCLLRSSC
jgi:hypothetical protein